MRVLRVHVVVSLAVLVALAGVAYWQHASQLAGQAIPPVTVGPGEMCGEMAGQQRNCQNGYKCWNISENKPAENTGTCVPSGCPKCQSFSGCAEDGEDCSQSVNGGPCWYAFPDPMKPVTAAYWTCVDNKFFRDCCTGLTCSVDNKCHVIGCGNSVVEGNEECDDGNAVNTDDCVQCKNPKCRDGFVWSGHEECDDGNASHMDACKNDCTLPYCGDNLISNGETCDDGNEVPGDGCNANCQIEKCGNGTREDLEDCDDGNQIDTDACTNTCEFNFSCPQGGDISQITASCRNQCGMNGQGGTETDHQGRCIAACVCECRNGQVYESSDCYNECVANSTENNGPNGLQGSPANVGAYCKDGDETTNCCRAACIASTCPVEDDDSGGDIGGTQSSSAGGAGGGGQQGGGGSTGSNGGTTGSDGAGSSGNGSQQPSSTTQGTSTSSVSSFSSSLSSFDVALFSSTTSSAVGCGWDGFACSGPCPRIGETCQLFIPSSPFADSECRCCLGDCGESSSFSSLSSLSSFEVSSSLSFSVESSGSSFSVSSFSSTSGGFSSFFALSIPSVPRMSFASSKISSFAGVSSSLIIVVNSCGDGLAQPPEQCDDGNARSGDGCDAYCKREFTQSSSAQSLALVLVTDDSRANAPAELLVASATVCGNGVLELREECDDTNRRDGDGCNGTCLLEIGICGDGIVQSLLGEQCEQSTHDLSLLYQCRSCLFHSLTCGDGKPDPGEECDDGERNSTSPNANCRPDCHGFRCGDGILDATETCDDGNRLNWDGCSIFCKAEDDGTLVAAETESNLLAASFPTPPAGMQQYPFPQFSAMQFPYQLPFAQLQPLITKAPTTTQTGPAAIAVIGAGAAAGFGWMRRKIKR